MAAVEREMQKTRLIFKKNASVIKQSKALARKINSLSPPNMAVAIFSFFVMASSGVHKKGLRNMLESLEPKPTIQIDSIVGSMDTHHIEQCRNILIEDMESETEPLMEEESDPLLEEMAIQIEEMAFLLEEVAASGKLKVRDLNNEVKNIKPKTLSVKEQKRLRFHQFMKAFEERLKSIGIEGDENLSKFLQKMIGAVHRVKIGKRREEPKNV